MKAEPFISVIIPCHNRASMVGKTIHSLQRQDYNNYEIIVVDDGSTDNTQQVVTGMANERTKYFKKVNGERAAARNYGARLAKGVYLNFFDSDDIALPNHLSEAVKLISEKEEPEWLHLGYKWADSEGKVFKIENKFAGQFLNNTIADGNQLSCNGVFVRKNVFLQHLFNEDKALAGSEDYELWLRLAARYPLHYTNVVTSVITDHKSLKVRKTNDKTLVRRLKLLLYYLQQDKEVMIYYKKQFHKIKMDSHSYIALYLAEQPSYKLKSIYYMLVAISNSLRYAVKRRFYATIKKILFQW
jgi:glycosyltransferase involved in cell wall biosynthesis